MTVHSLRYLGTSWNILEQRCDLCDCLFWFLEVLPRPQVHPTEFLQNGQSKSQFSTDVTQNFGRAKDLHFGTRCQRSIVMSRKGSHLGRTTDAMADAMAGAIRKTTQMSWKVLEGHTLFSKVYKLILQIYTV